MCPSTSPCHTSRLWLGSVTLSSRRRRRQKGEKAVQPFQVASSNQIRRTDSELVVDCASKSSSSLSSSSSQPQLICDSFSSTQHYSTLSLLSSTPYSFSSSISYKTSSSTAFFIILSLITLLSAHINSVSASGFFELQVLDGVHNSTTVHVCLKEFWNSQINFNRCTFGQKMVIFNSNNNNGNNDAQQHNRRQSTVKVPFSFRWIGSFSFTLQLSENLVAHGGVNRFVVEDEFAVPALDWKMRTFHAKDGRVVSIRFRISCDAYYHAEDCATFCRARNDTFGHYACQQGGQKVCLDGWKGENCDKPKCRSGCNEVHGFCESPNECTCRSGWKGANCDECVEYPGCLHGYCLSPFQCICHRNWGGILCDQDLNYCGTHEPCLNEGRCENIAPDNYRCVCKRGFSGVNCQVVEDACATGPCLHGGTCDSSKRTSNSSSISTSTPADFRCTCRPGFTGSRCERDLNECATSPCLHGGTCHDLENDFRCSCPSGWTGERCEVDVDECQALLTPCIRASACINTNGSYVCVCEKGFEGVFCEIEVDDCAAHQVQCANGGFCIDLVDDFRCVCATGFTGSNCHLVDQAVCELMPSHVWRFNDSHSGDKCEEKICICDGTSKHGVACTCASDRRITNQEELCSLDGALRHHDSKQEIRVSFDDALSPVGSCDAIYAIHWLISSTNSSSSEEEEDSNEVSKVGKKNNSFCCRLASPTEVLLKVEADSPLASFISRTLFPQLVQLMVNSKSTLELPSTLQNNSSDWSFLEYGIALFVSSTVAGVYLMLRARLKRRRAKDDAQNVVIHCIQNNLKTSSPGAAPGMTTLGRGGHFRSLSPADVGVGKKVINSACSWLHYGNDDCADQFQEDQCTRTIEKQSKCISPPSPSPPPHSHRNLYPPDGPKSAYSFYSIS